MSNLNSSDRSKCLVTGGAGFIGSHVTDELLQLGCDVTVLDDLSGGFEDNVNTDARFIRGSVTDFTLIENIYAEYKFDYVYHLAAYAAEGLSHFIRRFNYTNNLIGSVNLINAAVRYGCKCFVFTSSIAVYGAAQLPMIEDMTPEPEDPYGIAKHAVELDLAAARRLFGLDYIVFRPHNVYGERQNIGDKYRNVIGIFMNRAMQGLPATVFGDGTQTRAFSHISDVAPVIAKSAFNERAYGEVFNIGADIPYSVATVAEMVQKAIGRFTGIEHLPARNEVLHAHSGHEKARRILGSVPRVSLEQGLAEMAAWARRIGPRSSQVFNGIEVDKNLPHSWRQAHVQTLHG